MSTTIMNTLEEFMASPDMLVADTAFRIATLKSQYEAGDMTAAEYTELTQNMIDARRIQALTEGLQTQNTINAIFSKLFALASIIV